MPLSPVFRYFVDVRLFTTSNHRKSLHIDACSPLGAMIQTTKLLEREKVKDIYSITIRSEAYPIAKRERRKLIKLQGREHTFKRDNKKTIQKIKDQKARKV